MAFFLVSSHGSPVLAQGLADVMPCRDVASWNTMLTGYAQAGMAEEAKVGSANDSPACTIATFVNPDNIHMRASDSRTDAPTSPSANA